jgi:hypothetical protein
MVVKLVSIFFTSAIPMIVKLTIKTSTTGKPMTTRLPILMLLSALMWRYSTSARILAA